MRTAAIAIILLVSSNYALAQTPLTCWYNENGVFTGADGGNNSEGNAQPGQAARVGNSGDYTWAYILGPDKWIDGSSCPAKIPEGAYVAN